MRGKILAIAWPAAAAVILAVWAPRRPAATPVIDLIPPESEVVVGLNVRSLIDSPLFNAVVDQSLGRKQFEEEIQKIKKMSDIDLRSDVNRLYWFGYVGKTARVKHPPEGLFLAEGRFNEEALAALAREEQNYGTVRAGGRTVYMWRDGSQTRGACFLSENQLLMGEDLGRLIAYLEAQSARGVDEGRKDTARRLLDRVNDSTLLIAYSPPGTPNSGSPHPLGKPGLDALLFLDSALFEVKLLDNEVLATADFSFAKTENARNAFSIAAVALNALRLLTAEDPEAQAYLDAIEIGHGENQQSLRASIRIKNDAIVEAMTEAKASAANEKIVSAAKDAQNALEQVVQAHKDIRKPTTADKPKPVGPDVAAELQEIKRQLDTLQKTLEELQRNTAKPETTAPKSK